MTKVKVLNFFISTIENSYLWVILIIEKLMGISLGGSLLLFNIEAPVNPSEGYLELNRLN